MGLGCCELLCSLQLHVVYLLGQINNLDQKDKLSGEQVMLENVTRCSIWLHLYCLSKIAAHAPLPYVSLSLFHPYLIPFEWD